MTMVATDSTESNPQTGATLDWKERKRQEALAFRAAFEEQIHDIEHSIDISKYGPNADREIEVSFAVVLESWHYFTFRLKWGVYLVLMADSAEVEKKRSSLAFSPAPLRGGHDPDGTRRIQANVAGFDILVVDFDKGDVTHEKLALRVDQLGLEALDHASFSHQTTESELVWATTAPNPKTKEPETKPSAFQQFATERFSITEASQVTGEIARAFMVERQDYDSEALGEVVVRKTDHTWQIRKKLPKGGHRVSEFKAVVVGHGPISKLRLIILLAKRVERWPGESDSAFQARWENEYYRPVCRMLGFKYDGSCATIERAFYCMNRRQGTEEVPARHYVGLALDPDTDDRVKVLREQPVKPEPKSKKPASPGPSRPQSQAGADWRGFLAADAAVATLDDTLDKRDGDKPGVAVDCPFRSAHTTTPDGRYQCYIQDARSTRRSPRVTCKSSTCESRPAEEFLDALFSDETKNDPQYRLIEEDFVLPLSGGFVVPLGKLQAALRAMNERWCVVKIGGRTRYLNLKHNGRVEFLNKDSLRAWFEAAYYEYLFKGEIKHGSLLGAWLRWTGRQEYRGFGFFPAPAGHRNACPAGYYNAYRGFTVQPRKGSWKLLCGHLYRNVAQRNPEYFRWLMAWLAQMVQQPHIKPGTHVVLRGKEGVGKSKLAEWIIRLFGPNAMPITSASRLAGRFNAHFETIIFALAEEALWAGDKTAEACLKALATAEELDYERKGLDTEAGQNYLRLMFASNEDWVVPSASGGRRWFVLEVGDEHEKDYAYFAALDQEMENGGLEAMLYDLQRHDFSAINVRAAPVTEWLVEQRLYSYDTKRRWWRDVLVQGGFRIDDGPNSDFIALSETEHVTVPIEDVFRSARPHFGTERRKANKSELGTFLKRELKALNSFTKGPRLKVQGGARTRTLVFPPLPWLRDDWQQRTGETVSDDDSAGPHPVSVEATRERLEPNSMNADVTLPEEAEAITKAVLEALLRRGISDPAILKRVLEAALEEAGVRVQPEISSARYN